MFFFIFCTKKILSKIKGHDCLCNYHASLYKMGLVTCLNWAVSCSALKLLIIQKWVMSVWNLSNCGFDYLQGTLGSIDWNGAPRIILGYVVRFGIYCADKEIGWVGLFHEFLLWVFKTIALINTPVLTPWGTAACGTGRGIATTSSEGQANVLFTPEYDRRRIEGSTRGVLPVPRQPFVIESIWNWVTLSSGGKLGFKSISPL